MANAAVIVGYARTPFTSFLGKLGGVSAPELGAQAIQGAIASAGLRTKDVELVVMGQVVTAGCGQSPARQAAVKAGISLSADVYGVNKVCASGMKAISLAAAEVLNENCEVAVAGGMESMSNIPHILRKLRTGATKVGNVNLEDILISDGLWCAFNDIHMGRCAEKVAAEQQISRAEQDAWALASYRRASEAWSSGRMSCEVLPLHDVSKDEEIGNLRLEKVASLKPSFIRDVGTITAANASKLSDGAAAVIVTTEEYAKKNRLPMLAKIRASADFALDPIDFSLAPVGAIERALGPAKLRVQDVDFWEIDEAFASALSHPIGASGARLVGTLSRILKSRDARIGVAAICTCS
jgi:acetyl-CoA C-acetyltransferase